MKKKKRKFPFILLAVIISLVMAFLYFIYPTSINDNYSKKIEEAIYQNTDIENINYLNKDNNYYIIKDDKDVIVLDLNYDEVYRTEISKIASSDLDLTYSHNNLYYKEKVRDKDHLTYNFYDVKTLKLISDSEVGGA